MFKFINKIVFTILFALIAVISFRLNFYTHLAADDFYCYFLALENGPLDMANILWGLYMNWSGRVILHALSYIFFCLGVNFFHAINAVGYMLLLGLILFHGCYKNFFSPAALIFANLALFFCTPAFGEDFLWLMGSCNYMWGIIIVLAFLIPFRIQIEKDSDIFKHKKRFVTAMFVFGVIAAATNENTPVAILAMILVFMYLIRRKCGYVFKWMWTALGGGILGAVILLFAPGNFRRLAVESGGLEVDVVKNFFDITALYVDPNFLLWPLVFAVIFAFFSKGKCFESPFLVYLAGLLVSMYAMVGSPYYADRAKLASLVLALIFALCFYGKIEFKFVLPRIAIGLFAILSLWVSTVTIGGAVKDVRDFHKAEVARIEQIQREKNYAEVILEENKPNSKYVACFKLVRITKDKNAGINVYYAKYYGAKAVRVK